MSGPVTPPSHFVADAAITASALMDRSLGGKPFSGRELLFFGAVYFNRKRLTEDVTLIPGELIRVHPNPRRFPGESVDWRKRIVFEDDSYLIVDKPAGVPVHATCDNRQENVLAFLQRSYSSPLLICHRLDIGTEGLMAVAKTREFCREFGRWMADRQVRKRYRALVSGPMPLREVVHYMAPGDRAPHVVAENPQEGWKVCRLELTACQPVGSAFEVEMTLGTGRHHQIRAQLSALGFPIIGDILYGAEAAPSADDPEAERVALQAFELEFPDGRRFAIPANWKCH